MRFTKCFALILSLLMLFGLTACGAETAGVEVPVAEAVETEEAPAAEAEAVEEEPVVESEVEVVAETAEDEAVDVRFENVELVGCWFVKSVHALDGEYIGSGYEEREGKVFVDLVLYVNNDTEKDFDDECISGIVVYEGVKRELQFARESSHLAAMSSDPIGAGEVGYVHLFTLLPEEAVNETVTVTYTLNGEEYTCEAEEKSEQDPLEAKTRLEVGDVSSVYDGQMELKVTAAEVVENMQASNQSGAYYPGPFVLVELEVTNNHPSAIVDNIFSYAVIEDGYSRISPRVENDAGDGFAYLEMIAPGETQTVYIFMDKEEDMDEDDMIIRFNFAENCYYVQVAE